VARKRTKQTGKNSRKFVIEKEYYEDVTFTHPDSGEILTQKNVKITRYRLLEEIDSHGPSYSDNDFVSKIGNNEEDYEE